MLIDTHAHLDFPEFVEDLDHVLLRAKQAGVERIITIGSTLQSSRKAIQLAEHYPQIYASVGIHPNSASQEREDFLSELEEMVRHPKVVAVGETGLDYYRLASRQEESEVSQTTFGAAFNSSPVIASCYVRSSCNVRRKVMTSSRVNMPITWLSLVTGN
jgi:Tat protein secretion system quality control protein TatD with DNase activity